MMHLNIAVSYFVCFALTVFLVTPIQSLLLPEVTAFASLVYFPHGVKILATWCYGWKAIPGLFAGSVAAALLLTPAEHADLLRPKALEAILFSSIVAFIAFELIRLSGRNLYWSPSLRVNWRNLVFVGAVASVANSVGSTFIYSRLINADYQLHVLLIYVAGDLIGLMACMLGLMLAFRWARILAE